MEATYQPIKRGMTEAVTRGELEAAKREGRDPVANVKQLTWFEAPDNQRCLYGVLDGSISCWRFDGKNDESMYDLFALPRYEWQWLTISPNGIYYSTTVHFQTAEEAIEVAEKLGNLWRVERIEGSKRLVKE